jgi:hypothetical protein
MPHVEYLVAAEGHSVDQQTNALSIFNILEKLQTTSRGDNVVPRVVVITVFGRDDGDDGQDFQALLEVHTRSGQIGRPFPLNFRMSAERHRLFHVLFGLPIPANAGFIRFDVQVNGQPVGSYQVDVEAAQEPPSG